MSLESFFGLDQNEGQISAEAAEKFQEQMRRSAAASKAMAGHQQRQKQKEDKLAKIFIKFLKTSAKGDLVFLVVSLLEQNVPAAFILAILMISDAELEKDLELSLEMKGKEENFALTHFNEEDSLPQNIRNELNAWGDEILKAGLMRPGKTLASVLTPEQKLKSIVLDLIEYSLHEYFKRHAMEFSEDKIRKFALVSLQSVLIQLREIAKEKTDDEIIETPLKE